MTQTDRVDGMVPPCGGRSRRRWPAVLLLATCCAWPLYAAGQDGGPEAEGDPGVQAPGDRPMEPGRVAGPGLLMGPGRLESQYWARRCGQAGDRNLLAPDDGGQHILWSILRNKADQYSGKALREAYRSQYDEDPDWRGDLDRDRRSAEGDPTVRRDLLRESGARGGSRFGGDVSDAADGPGQVLVDWSYWEVDDDLRLRVDCAALIASLFGPEGSAPRQAAGSVPGVVAVRDFLAREGVQVNVDVRVDLESSTSELRDTPLNGAEGRLRFRWVDRDGPDRSREIPVEGVLRYEWRPLEAGQISFDLVKSF